MRRRIITPANSSVVGLDLSLRASAACALPLPWDFDLAKVRMMKCGEKLGKDATPQERAERIAQIAHDVVNFCLNVKATHVGVEDHAFGAGGAHAMMLAELHGVVKHEILETLFFAAVPLQASNVRKILLQHVPRLGAGKTKPFVIRNVKRLGPIAEAWTEDECDAFCVANTVLDRAGYTALSFPGE